MRLRAVHFASVLLLIASLGAAEGSVARDSECTFNRHYIGVLVAQHEAIACTRAAFGHAACDALSRHLAAASLAQYRTPWKMRPPSAHSADVHAATGSSL